jgi:hypothetical protein
VPERLIDTVTRHIYELGQVAPKRGIHVAHEDQAGRDLLALEIRRLPEQIEPGEVNPAQVGEVEGRLGQALPGDISEPLPQRGHLVGTDLRPDRDADLVWHRERPPHPGPTYWSTKLLSSRTDRAIATSAADDLSTPADPCHLSRERPGQAIHGPQYLAQYRGLVPSYPPRETAPYRQNPRTLQWTSGTRV